MKFVPLKIAKKLRECGFREPCIAYYYNDSTTVELNNVDTKFVYGLLDYIDAADLIVIWNEKEHKKEIMDFVDAPIVSQVLDWFRETHHLSIEAYFCKHKNWQVTICDTNLDGNDEDIYLPDAYETYYDGAIAGIEYALDNIQF